MFGCNYEFWIIWDIKFLFLENFEKNKNNLICAEFAEILGYLDTQANCGEFRSLEGIHRSSLFKVES